jgi:hypothetical protein
MTSLAINRVLARILDLGRVSNDQGVHMSITLNSQIHGSIVMFANNRQCLWLFHALQPNTRRAYAHIAH